MGDWAADYLGVEREQFVKSNPHVLPHAYVSAVLRRAAGMTPIGAK